MTLSLVLAALASLSLHIVVEKTPFVPVAAFADGIGGAARTVASLPFAMQAPLLQLEQQVIQNVVEEAVGEAVDEAAWDLPNLDHPRVDYWVNQFQTKRRRDFAIFLTRKQKYAGMISEKLAARAMPQDLIYLAMIESGFNPTATSPAKARGLWQFIEATAERYGLKVNRRIDERTDPVKSTEAALAYLSDLHGQFGSWYLAAAAYNTGEARIARIMRRETGSERGSEHSYYQIAHHLPKETADYVPLMIAAARIAKEPAKYGFTTGG